MANVTLIRTLFGLYGVMFFAVARRRFEIGVLMALGTDNKNTLGLVIRKAFYLTIISLVIGLFSIPPLCRLMFSLAHDIRIYEPAMFLLIPLLLLNLAMPDCYLPAWRRSIQWKRLDTNN